MGFMDELAEMATSVAGLFRSTTGAADPALLRDGTPGTAIITALRPSGTTIAIMNGLTERICSFELQVTPASGEPYPLTITQGIPEVWIPQLTTNPVVAVRIDPADPTRVAIDVAAGPAVGGSRILPAKPADDHDSAAWILANGTPVIALVGGSRPLPGVKNVAGDDVYLLSLTIEPTDAAPYPVQVGNAVPAASLGLLVAGARLEARRGDDPGDIVIDWAANGPAPTTIT